MKWKQYTTLLLIVVFMTVVSGCEQINNQEKTSLIASGTISATYIDIAPQIGGKVQSVNVSEGDIVQMGQELFRLDSSLLEAQFEEATAGIKLAVESLNLAQNRYELALYEAHGQDRENRTTGWESSQPDEFELPVWYFLKEEKIASALVNIDYANSDLESEKKALNRILSSDEAQGFIDAEKRLSEAQAAFEIADQVLEQAKDAKDKEELQDIAQDKFDIAKAELESAQADYDLKQKDKIADDILKGRARVHVAQEGYDRALDYYSSLLSGSDSLPVKIAETSLKQAEAVLSQAEAAAAVLQVQLSKMIIQSPVDATVMVSDLEIGETIAPSAVAMTLGQLDQVNLTVYIPEMEYGKIRIGDQVSVTVDSFPGKTFLGEVVYISDQAEFTPKNVQTIDGRRATVYAIKIRIPNPENQLKPGMPADALFEISQ